MDVPLHKDALQIAVSQGSISSSSIDSFRHCADCVNIGGNRFEQSTRGVTRYRHVRSSYRETGFDRKDVTQFLIHNHRRD